MTSEITSALRTLYGDKALLSPALLRSLQPESLRTVFRRRALQLHPDRALVLGKSAEEMNEAFKDVKLAYELLIRLPKPFFGQSVFTCYRASPPSGHSRPDNPGDHYWGADIPDTSLLFGQFLYYAGLITFNTLISAITWQCRQRPSFGKIARMWDYLTDEEVRRIVILRQSGERIGDAATRRGYLTTFQCSTILGFQKYLQRPIGEFFQEVGILEEEEISYLILLMRKHNRRMARMSSCW